MQYVFLIRSLAVRNTSRGATEWRISYNQRESVSKTRGHGQEPVSIFIANLHAIFKDILRKKHGTLFYRRRSAALRQWASLWGVFLNSVRPMGSTPFNAFPFWVILRLNAHELLAFVCIFVECMLPRQSPIANRVLRKFIF